MLVSLSFVGIPSASSTNFVILIKFVLSVNDVLHAKSPVTSAAPVTSKSPEFPIVTVVPSSSTKPVDKVVGPVHFANLFVAPVPVIAEVLSIFCHVSVAPDSIKIAQSPTFQSVIPSKFVLPATLTI